MQVCDQALVFSDVMPGYLAKILGIIQLPHGIFSIT